MAYTATCSRQGTIGTIVLEMCNARSGFPPFNSQPSRPSLEKNFLKCRFRLYFIMTNHGWTNKAFTL
jgi:hypothetical protein